MSRMEFRIGLLASGLSIVIGIIVAFLTHEFVVGLVCAVVVFRSSRIWGRLVWEDDF